MISFFELSTLVEIVARCVYVFVQYKTNINTTTVPPDNGNVQHQSKVWTHLLIQGFFFIFTIFYIVE